MHINKVISKDKFSDDGEILFPFCTSPGCAGVLRPANMLYCDVILFHKTKVSCPSVS